MRSAVPLHCFIDVVKSQRVAGQRPRQGTKSCRMGRNSVHPYVRTSIHPFICPLSRGQLFGSEGLPEEIEGLPEGSGGLPEGSGGLPKGSEGLTEGSESLLKGSQCLSEGRGEQTY